MGGRGRGKFDNIVTSQAVGPLAAPPGGSSYGSGSWGGGRGTTSSGFSRLGSRDSHSPLIRSQSPRVKTEEGEEASAEAQSGGGVSSARDSSREGTVDLNDMHDMAISMGEQNSIPGHIEQYFPIRIDKREPEEVSVTAAGFSNLSLKDSLLEDFDDEKGVALPKEILEVSRALEQGRYMAPEQVDEARRAVLDSVAISREFGLGGSDSAELEQKLYLFQLPPIIPEFRAQERQKSDAEAVGAESEGAEGADGAESDAEAAADPEMADVQVVEDVEMVEPELAEGQLPEGKVGKLRLHKSGKLTMVIGDIVMDVCQGVPAKFLQDIVVCSPEEEKAYLIGQIKRKMVVTPKLDELL